MLHDTGMRIGEALGLRHEDWAAAERTVAVVPRINDNDIIEPTEEVCPDHSEHATTPHPIDDDELERALSVSDASRCDGPVGPR